MQYSKRWLPILEQLEHGLMVVTASNRQADFLRQQYRYYQRQNHLTVWQRPAIITDKLWLISLYQQVQIKQESDIEPWSLLTDQESRLLWEDIIEDDGDYLLDTRRTAERVRQAANRLEQWLLTDEIDDDDRFSWREETQRFKDWYLKNKQQYQNNYWLEHYQLDDWLSSRVSSISLPQQIGFLGFQQISPARKKLFSALEELNITLLTLKPDAIESTVYRLELADTQEEIKQSALWAKQQWLEKPEQRIGIVIPNLNNHRELTKLTFERIFCATQIINNDQPTQRPFDISLGLSLANYPIIDSALTLLKLISEALPQDEMVQLLFSPFVTATEQQSHCIAISNLLRKSRQATFTTKDLHFYSKQIDSDNSSFATLVQALIDFNSKGKKPASQWAIEITELLTLIQWGEKRSLSSHEYQTKESWNKKIEQMAIYDQLTGNMSWYKFRKLFQRSIYETLFQPQTGDCPIQIMGVLEAAFLTFDKIRICGIDNRLWPENANPSPFIPYELQRTHDMPNATAERELEISKQLLNLLSESANEVIFSHAKGNGEETLSVSPLLEDMEVRNFTNKTPYLTPAEQINNRSKELEYLTDDRAPKIQTDSIRGGSKLLQDIARCQFRAFAHHRLFANAADDAREGLDPLDRGNLVHQVLEHCWRHIFDKQQTNLQELYLAKQLEEAIRPSINTAIERLQNERHTELPPAIVNIEKQRLERVLMQWFEMEIKRPHFSVKELEQSVDAPIAGNIIRVQLDRVDTLEDGSLAIIDYKTGKVNRNNWFGERPDEPQLPLYAMVLSDQNKTIGALLYGQVKNKECRFYGVADDKTLISGVTKDFEKDPVNPDISNLDTQVIQWRNDLQNLMHEYLSGEAAVTPRDENVCTYCDLHGLCRIVEMSQRTPEQTS